MDSFTNITGSIDNPLPSDIEYIDDDGNPVNLTVNWDFQGLGCPEVGYNSRSGIFGFINTTGSENGLIDIEPNGKIIENEGIQLIVGQFLALKGGNLGFFLATLFRINPHLIFLDLESYIRHQGARLEVSDRFISKHPDWSSFHSSKIGRFGLGPFNLPYDWPKINWPNFTAHPLVELNRLIVEMINGVSISGEPFVFSFLRWVVGAVRNVIPDLNEFGLGWQKQYNGDIISVHAPNIPFSITGQGTYEMPYSICITEASTTNIYFEVWIGPDGPISGGQVEQVVSIKDKELFDLFGEDSLDILELNYSTDGEWASLVGDALCRLASYSERVRSAIGDHSKSYIEESLLELDTLLKTSDGMSSILSQQSGTTLPMSRPNVAQSTHFNSIQSEPIIEQIIEFISEHVNYDWNPNTGIQNGNKNVFVFVSPNQESDWGMAMSRISEYYLDANNSPAQLSNRWSLIYPVVDEKQVGFDSVYTTTPNIVDSDYGLVTVQLSENFSDSGLSYIEGIKSQLLQTISLVGAGSVNSIYLVAHSYAGKALLECINENNVDENLVEGVLTINSPNDGTILDESSEKVRFAINFLSSILQTNDQTSTSESNLLALSELRTILTHLLEVKSSGI